MDSEQSEHSNTNTSVIPPNSSAKQEAQINVKTWLQLDAQRRHLADQTKEIRSSQKKLEDDIIKFMQSHNLTELTMGDGKLNLTTTNNKTQIKPTALATILKDKGLNDDQLADIMNSIEASRGIKTNKALKRKSNNNSAQLG